MHGWMATLIRQYLHPKSLARWRMARRAVRYVSAAPCLQQGAGRVEAFAIFFPELRVPLILPGAASLPAPGSLNL